jgi:hypothetical protein
VVAGKRDLTYLKFTVKLPNTFISWLLLSLTSLSFLSAQNAEEPISFNFSVVILGDTYKQYEKIKDVKLRLPVGEEQFEEFTLRIDSPSELRRYTGSPDLRFYQVMSSQNTDEANATGAESVAPIMRPFVNVSIPIGTRADMLIAIVVPAKKKPLAIAFPLPENLDTPGYAYTLNLSNSKMAARINDAKGVILPGTYFETNLNGISNYKLRIDLAVEQDGSWQRVVSTATTATPQSRLLFLLYQSPTTGRWVQKKLALPDPIAAEEAQPGTAPGSSL